MGMEAAKGALAEWGGQYSDITHIIWGSMTGGMFAPSMDITLAVELGLSLTVKRLNVENMGCLTGFRCLGLAASIAKENPAHKILLVVGDVRNALGNCFTRDYEDKSNVIVASLFRDSCASCVVSGKISNQPFLYKIHHHESLIVKDTYHLVKYAEKNDDAVHLFISKELPYKVVEAIPTLVGNLLKSFPDVTPADCNFCLHTGGPRIINGIKSSLEGLTDDHFTASWEVMKMYGNLSGSSNLVVLDFNRRTEYSRWNICLSVGPGICLESLLVERPPEGELTIPLEEVRSSMLSRTSVISFLEENVINNTTLLLLLLLLLPLPL